MRLHGNAALSWRGRRLLARRVVVEGWTLRAAAEAAGVSVRCGRKWVGRYRLEGELGLGDRSSAPRCVANRTAPERVEAIVKLRRLRFTAAEIAETLGMALSTVSGILTRSGMGRLGRLGLEPAVRYERQRPGELLHIDVKKLGRIQGGAGWRVRGGPQHYNPTFIDRDGLRRRTVGWEYVHVCVDDYSRLAYAEVLPDEKATTAIGFLRRAVRFYHQHGITVQRVLTDNGSAYRSTLHALACHQLGIRHTRTRPYRPQTNGKAERFIRTLLNGWAYAAIYRSSTERTKTLDGWLWHYNHRRRHRPRTGGTRSSSSSSWVTSLRLPPVSVHASGMPPPSTSRWCLLPARPRSTGLGPVLAPHFSLAGDWSLRSPAPTRAGRRRAARRAATRATCPKHRPAASPQPPPRGHAAAEAKLLGQMLHGFARIDIPPKLDDDADGLRYRRAGPFIELEVLRASRRRAAPSARASGHLFQQPVARSIKSGDPLPLLLDSDTAATLPGDAHSGTRIH